MGSEVYRTDPRAAQEQLGHADLRTTVDYYVQDEALILAQADRVLPILEALPQPGEVSLGEPAADDPQRWLFS
jgi:hypothetical protein